MKLWQAFVCALILSLLSGGGAVNVGGSGAATANAAQPQEARGVVLPSSGALPGAETASRVAEDRAAEMVTLINVQRAAVGLPPLIEVRGLDSAAADHNTWMAAHIAPGQGICHECPGEPQIGARTGRYGYGWGGEIIAAGPPTVAEAVRVWMDSPGHKAIILGQYVTVGCDFWIVTSPAPGQFPTYQTCDFSGDQPHGDAVQPGAAPTATPTTRYLPTLTRTPFPRTTPTPTATGRVDPTWTPYVVWPPTATPTPPQHGSGPITTPVVANTPLVTRTPTPQPGGAWYLTIEVSPWAGATTQNSAANWLCGRFGVVCRWERR